MTTKPRTLQETQAQILDALVHGDEAVDAALQAGAQAIRRLAALLEAVPRLQDEENKEDGAALIHQTIPTIEGTEPRLDWDEKAELFRAGRRSAFTHILGQIAESSPDLVRVCPCENPYCSEAVHRNGRVKPTALTGAEGPIPNGARTPFSGQKT